MGRQDELDVAQVVRIPLPAELTRSFSRVGGGSCRPQRRASEATPTLTSARAVGTILRRGPRDPGVCGALARASDPPGELPVRREALETLLSIGAEDVPLGTDGQSPDEAQLGVGAPLPFVLAGEHAGREAEEEPSARVSCP